MKPVKFILISFLLVSTSAAFAQHPSVTFFGGVNGSSVGVKVGDSAPADEDSYKMLFGLNVGALYDYVLKKNRREEFSVESGLIFETKGYNQKRESITFDKFENKTTLYYLDIPVYLKYRYRFRSRDKIYFGIGPYVGVGLFGNESLEFQASGADQAGSSSDPINWGSDESEDDYKRLDYGISAKAGFWMDNGFNIALSYDYGLPNTDAELNRETKHRVIRLSLGYTLKFED